MWEGLLAGGECVAWLSRPGLSWDGRVPVERVDDRDFAHGLGLGLGLGLGRDVDVDDDDSRFGAVGLRYRQLRRRWFPSRVIAFGVGDGARYRGRDHHCDFGLDVCDGSGCRACCYESRHDDCGGKCA